jgi:hypothetical protein
VSYSSQLTISEMGDPGTFVILQGASLPFQGAEWSGENRITTTWYPGNPDEATQQVLGPKEVPSHWRGVWRRTLMGRSDSYASASNSTGQTQAITQPWMLRDLLEDVFRRGRRLEVIWSTVQPPGETSPFYGPSSGLHLSLGTGFFPPQTYEAVNDKIRRQGRVRSWKWSHDRAQDIHWEIEFDWLGRGRTQQKVTSTRDDSAQATVNALAAAVNTLYNLIVPPLDPFTTFLRSIQTNISTLNSAVQLGYSFATLPLSLASQVVDLCRNTVGLCDQTVDQFGREPPELAALNMSVHDMTIALSHGAQVCDAAVQVARGAQTSEVKLRDQQQSGSLQGQLAPQNTTLGTPQVIQKYLTRQGDTPQSISMTFYGTPDAAVQLLKANRLPWYQASFPPGQVLVIPVLPTILKS